MNTNGTSCRMATGVRLVLALIVASVFAGCDPAYPSPGDPPVVPVEDHFGLGADLTDPTTNGLLRIYPHLCVPDSSIRSISIQRLVPTAGSVTLSNVANVPWVPGRVSSYYYDRTMLFGPGLARVEGTTVYDKASFDSLLDGSSTDTFLVIAHESLGSSLRDDAVWVRFDVLRSLDDHELVTAGGAVPPRGRSEWGVEVRDVWTACKLLGEEPSSTAIDSAVTTPAVTSPSTVAPVVGVTNPGGLLSEYGAGVVVCFPEIIPDNPDQLIVDALAKPTPGDTSKAGYPDWILALKADPDNARTVLFPEEGVTSAQVQVILDRVKVNLGYSVRHVGDRC